MQRNRRESLVQSSLGPRPSRDSLTKVYLTSEFLVVLSQHVNVNCVIRPDNHVILYQFASSISVLPVRACACRAALPFCHMIVSIQRSDWVTRFKHADSAQPTFDTYQTRGGRTLRKCLMSQQFLLRRECMDKSKTKPNGNWRGYAATWLYLDRILTDPRRSPTFQRVILEPPRRARRVPSKHSKPMVPLFNPLCNCLPDFQRILQL